MALDDTYNSATYNSYHADLAAFNTDLQRMDGLWGLAQWNGLSAAQQENIYLASCDNLNSYEYIGTLNAGVVSPDDMQWPRTGVAYTNGVAIGATEIPTFVNEYLIRRVLELSSYNYESQASGSTASGNVKKETVGSLSHEFFSPSELSSVGSVGVDLHDLAKSLPSYLYIEPYLVAEQAGSTAGDTMGVNYLTRS